jgi:hypothetical protein
MPYKRTTRTCPQCGKEFAPRKPAQRGCSRSCGNLIAGRRPPAPPRVRVAARCAHCGKTFWRAPSHIFDCAEPCCSKHCQFEHAKHPSLRADGYIQVNHNGRRRLQHVVVWEAAHGPVPPGHHIHHKDRKKSNNALDNLEAMPIPEHIRLHSTNAHWSRKHLCCLRCGTTERRHYALGFCKRCYQRRRRTLHMRRPGQ